MQNLKNIWKDIKELSNTQKARMISLFIIVIVLFLSIAGYAGDIRFTLPKLKEADELYVDGTDLAPVYNMVVGLSNTVFGKVIYIVILAAMGFMSLILLVPWRLIAIRRESEIAEIEIYLAKILFWAFVAISFVVSLLQSHFKHIIFLEVLVFIPAIILFLLAVRPMKKKRHSKE